MPSPPNLFRLKQGRENRRLYQLYLARLMQHGRWDRVVEASRQIRSYANRDRQPRRGDFTYQFEIDALCRLGNWSAAWRQLRRLELTAYGKSINLNAKRWRPDELDWFTQYHPHILYFLEHFGVASRLFEAMLEQMLKSRQSGLSYEILPYVYNPIPRPRRRQDVTLYHVYHELGRTLAQWSGWKQFVDGFHPKLFTTTGVGKGNLLSDPALLEIFYQVIQAEEKRRLRTGVSSGERDLVHAPSAVQRRQKTIARRKAGQEASYVSLQQDLERIFPELKEVESR